MPFRPGHKLSKGRPKGSINNRSVPLREKAIELGVCPFTILILFAKGDWKALGYKSETSIKYSPGGIENEELYIDPAVRAKAAAEAAQYIYPKLKQIDHKKDSLWDTLSAEGQLQAAENLVQTLKAKVHGS